MSESGDIRYFSLGAEETAWQYFDNVHLVIPPCIADLTDDGELNFFDVSVFLTYFQIGNEIADFTGDGQFNFFDVSAFLNAFTAGCP